jgi:4-diphosphocytidyl-2-C-methyl-D-erythritol kinase
MPSVIELARAKINLSLEVLGRRADGYHELRSVVAFADVGDRLKISSADSNELEVSGPFAADVPRGESNIIWKAWAHLRSIMDVPFASVQLEKNLPVASGIGGGSADAAAMLRGVLRLVDRQLSDEQVIGLAAIGADVPVCFLGKPALIEGVGEKISVLTEMLPPALVLINPLVPCSTVAVFAAMGLEPDIIRPSSGRAEWRNDMTAAAIKVQPLILGVLSALSKTALFPVLMSGSGATCFGLARDFGEAVAVAAELARLHPQWWVKPARLG